MDIVKKLGKVLFVIIPLLATATLDAAPVNINTADAKTLAENISGIGPKKAQAIVDYRQAKGPFKTVQDLTKVKGIGEKIIAKNKPDLLLNGESAKNVRK